MVHRIAVKIFHAKLLPSRLCMVHWTAVKSSHAELAVPPGPCIYIGQRSSRSMKLFVPSGPCMVHWTAVKVS